MCSSGFLQGLIGSPTQCGLPVVVIVPLSLLAPGTHGHPSLSISTPTSGLHPPCLAIPSPWTSTHPISQHLAIRLESTYRGTVDVPPGTQDGWPMDATTLLSRIGLARQSNGYLPQVTPDVSPYACIKRTGASWLSIHTWVHASG